MGIWPLIDEAAQEGARSFAGDRMRGRIVIGTHIEAVTSALGSIKPNASVAPHARTRLCLRVACRPMGRVIRASGEEHLCRDSLLRAVATLDLRDRSIARKLKVLAILGRHGLGHTHAGEVRLVPQQ